MLSRYFGPRIHSQIHIFLLCALAASVVVSKFVMSLAMMLLLLNILLEGNFKEYWDRIKKFRLLHWMALLFSIHLIGLIWSQNIDYGFHDVKVKIPLLLIPLILSAKPVTERKELKWILGIFLATVLFATLFNFLAYQQIFGVRNYDDIRGMSLFDSHVRLALMVVMAIVVVVQFYRWRKIPVFLMIAIVVWLHFYTYFSQVLSGAIVLIGIYCVYGFYWLYKRTKIVAYSSLAIVGILVISGLVWVFKPITYNKEHYSIEKLSKEKTAEGNSYTHHLGEVCPETGKPIDIYICHEELEREWNKVSDVPYELGRDAKGQLIFRTLTRYMASMDLRKDAQGFKQLSEKDIQSVEQGITSVYHRGIWSRIHGLRYQLNNATEPNGHSLLQRIEYWRTAVDIIQENWIIGVGGGDVQDTFNKQYDKNASLLSEEHRDRAHNMYLTFFLSFGIIGFLLLILSHLDFMRIQFSSGRLVGLAFITIVLISYLVEDTLETQSGVTFFGLFYGLYLYPFKKPSKT